jgi:hypothetical protein
MLFVLSITFCLGVFALAWFYWQQLDAIEETCQRRWLLGWAARGLLTPALVWAALNSGLAPGLPPLLPKIDAAQSSGGAWLPVFVDGIAPGWLVIGSQWAGLTFGWLAADLARRRADRRDVFIFGLTWGLLMLPLVSAALYVWRWWGLGLAATLWSWPVVHGLLNQPAAVKPTPFYSRAIAKMKFGKFDEAEWEVIHELEKRADDVEGWMLLAELYATAFHDLPTAEQTIHELCAQPNVTPSQVAVALHRLADWQLKVGDDPVAARRALEEICARMPDTHLAKMARLRSSQLPTSRQELAAARRGKTFRLPGLSDPLSPAAPAGPPLTRERAATLARQWVEKLKQDPNRTEAREEFARLLAEPLAQVEQAVEQLQLLLEMPNQPEKKRAEWLGLMAVWQLQLQRDRAAAQATLERLVREHPQSPQAFVAQQRLSMMAVEERMRRAREAAGSIAPSKWKLDAPG